MPRAFFGTFFRFERKYCPPRGGSPTVRAGVGASGPRQELLSAKLPYNAACRGFPLAPCTPSVRLPKRINNPTGLYLHSRAVVGASGSTEDFFGNAIVHRSKQGLSFE